MFLHVRLVQMKLMKIHPFQELPLVEKSSLLIKFAPCIIPEESILKQLEVLKFISGLRWPCLV